MVTRKLLPLSIGVASAAFAAGFAQRGLWLWTLAIPFVGLCWLAGQWLGLRPRERGREGGEARPAGKRGRAWMPSVGLSLFAAAALVGLYLGMGRGWVLAGLVAALSAWDLSSFLQSLEGVQLVAGARELERRHLERLLLVDVAGLGLAAAALTLRLTLGFGVVLLLAAFAIVALSGAIRFMRREGG